MIQVAYTSIARKAMSQSQLLLLLQQARLNNKALHVTGILLYKDRSFFQVIEGDEAVISRLILSISRDIRHHEFDMIFNRKIEKRNFEAWSMGFVNISEESYDLGECCNKEFHFPLQNAQGNLSQLIDVSTAKILVRQFGNINA